MNVYNTTGGGARSLTIESLLVRIGKDDEETSSGRPGRGHLYSVKSFSISVIGVPINRRPRRMYSEEPWEVEDDR